MTNIFYTELVFIGNKNLVTNTCNVMLFDSYNNTDEITTLVPYEDKVA